MTDPVDQASQSTDWHANDWAELRSIWDALLPEFAVPPNQVPRVFRGKNITSQDAGSVFERLVLEAFRLSGAEVYDPFRVASRYGSETKEQIDGLVVLNDRQAFLIESKLWTGGVDFGPIALLNHRVQRRPAGTLGLFFSAFGYTDPAIESAQHFQPLHVLMFDGKELKWALDQENLVELLKRKWIAAVKYGDPNQIVTEDDEGPSRGVVK